MVLKLLTLFFSLNTFGAIGEVNSKDYYGPFWPAPVVNSYGELQSAKEDEQRIIQAIDGDFFRYQAFFKEELVPNSLCADQTLKNKQGVVRQAFRASILSLLLEGIHARCDKAEVALKSCRPKSRHMKSYLKEVKKSLTWTIWGPQNKNICKSCRPRWSCKKMLSLWGDICSEKDQLFGLSYAPIIYQLLVQSDYFNDTQIISEGCLKRYMLSKKRHERYFLGLRAVLSNIHEEIDPRYPFGRGVIAHKIFSYADQGVVVFEEKEKIKPIVKVVKKVKVKRVSLKKKKKKLVKKEKPKIAFKEILKKVRPSKSVSALHRAADKIYQEGQSRSFVNMRDFYFDYIFSNKKIQELKKDLTLFGEVQSLKTMKKEDKLGTQKAPVPLLFIKFLIDSKNHQALYNIVHTLGEEFVILNDLEPKPRYQLLKVGLTMDEKETFEWQLAVLNDKSLKYEQKK